MWLAQSSVHRCRWRSSLGRVSGSNPSSPQLHLWLCRPVRQFRLPVLSLHPPPSRRQQTSLSSVVGQDISHPLFLPFLSFPTLLLFSVSSMYFPGVKSNKYAFDSSPSKGRRPANANTWSRAFPGTTGPCPGVPAASRSFPFGTASISDDSGKGEEKQGPSDLKISARELSGRWGDCVGRPRTQVGGRGRGDRTRTGNTDECAHARTCHLHE